MRAWHFLYLAVSAAALCLLVGKGAVMADEKAQPKLAAGKDEEKLRALLLEKRDAWKAAVEAARKAASDAKAPSALVLVLSRALLQAELDLKEKPAERVALW